MATKRQQTEWARAAVMTAYLIACHKKGGIDPIKLIPPCYRPEFETPVKTTEMIEDENRRGWAVMNRVFGQMGDKRKRKK